MCHLIYQNKNYKIYKVGNEFIIHNSNYKFQNNHTHIKKLHICKLLISLAKKKKLPKNPYLAASLIRISNDEKYIKKLKESIVTHNDFKRMMEDTPVYQRKHGAIRRVR